MGEILGCSTIAIQDTKDEVLFGRMDSWLGSDGKGLMDAFDAADLHSVSSR